MEGWVTESCFCVGGMESRKEGKDGWSDGYSSGPVFKRQLSKAQLSQQKTARVYVVFLLLSLTPPHKCVTCESVCERGREREREVWCRPLWWGAGALSPLLCLPASWAAASRMRSRDAALSAYLTLSFAHAPSALSLPLAGSLAHSLTRHARWSSPPPPSPPPPPPLSCHQPPTSRATCVCRAAAL